MAATPPQLHPADAVVPTYEIFEWRHVVEHPELFSAQEVADKRVKIMDEIVKDDMTFFYRDCCAKFSWEIDQQLMSTMERHNATTLEQLQEAKKEAVDKYGDIEIKDASMAIAHHYCRIGDYTTACDEYEKLISLSKGMESTAKVNTILGMARISFFQRDAKKTAELLDRAEKQFGGDWETRNRIRMYRGLHTIVNSRDWAAGGELLINGLSTFTCTEIVDFKHVCIVAVIVAMVALDRPLLTSTVAKSPEVNQVFSEHPELSCFFNALINCDYQTFFKHLNAIAAIVRCDPFLFPHYLYFVRHIRLVAYRQYIKPYKSIEVKNMANAFGVTEQFIEQEIITFVPCGLLTTRLDKVDRMLVNDQTGGPNSEQQEAMYQGDMLVNHLQMLSRVIDM